MGRGLQHHVQVAVARPMEFSKARPGRAPTIVKALAALRAAMGVEVPRCHGMGRRNHNIKHARRQRFHRLEANHNERAKKLERHENGKTYDCRLSEEWVQGMLCCAPTLSDGLCRRRLRW